MKKKIKERLKETTEIVSHTFTVLSMRKSKKTHTHTHHHHKKIQFGSLDEKQKERSKKGYIYQTERSKKGLYLSDWQNWKKLL